MLFFPNKNKGSFLHGQIGQLKEGGWPVFLRKLSFFVSVFLTAPIVLLIFLIKPFILLRFGKLTSVRIGHFAIDTEAYLCKRDQEKQSQRIIDIIVCCEPVCNRQLKVMWKRNLRIISGAWLWSKLDRNCQFLTCGDAHHINFYNRRADYRMFMNTKPHLSFTDDEHRQGQELLKKLGIPAESNWVCIHNRDSAYLDNALAGRWTYHDYRDFSVQTMVSAAEELSKRGYYVVRVGSIVHEAFKVKDPMIIDYANSSLRSDFLDIYLLANGAFFLGSDSGIFCIPQIFRKPLALVNFTVLSEFIDKDYAPLFVIFKRCYHKEKARFLSLTELFETGLASASMGHLFEEAGVELKCNTPEEIRDLAIEVDNQLKGQWQSKPEDEKLQQRFWDIFRQCALPIQLGDIHVRIGSSFLRNNTNLLDANQ